MRILGCDFTSVPSRRKPITVAVCRLEENRLRFEEERAFTGWADFEAFLARPDFWWGGFDLPFSLARRFVETSGGPADWPALVDAVGAMGRAGWTEFLDRYRQGRAAGDREHKRRTDVLTRSSSPQRIKNVPVAWMLCEGMPRLRAAGVRCWPMEEPGERTATEAYPGQAVRTLLGRKPPYKNPPDGPEKQAVRAALVAAIHEENPYGLTFDRVPEGLVEEVGADRLDAFLCALQSAWAYRAGADAYPADVDRLEGWIPDPGVPI